MKKILTFALALFTGSSMFAQKNDYIWEIGYNDHDSTGITGTRLDFNYTPVKVSVHNRGMDFVNFTNSGICDPAGNLQFYTNGLFVQDAADEEIASSLLLLRCPGTGGCAHTQSILTLPQPGLSSAYVLFTEEDTVVTADPATPTRVLFFNRLISVGPPDSGWDFAGKREPLVTDTLTAHLTAAKHANGRDWWILAPRNASPLYYKFLLTPLGYKETGSQSIGSAGDPWGESVFSPDGSRYVRMSGVNPLVSDLSISRFDRCSGLLSDNVSFQLHNGPDNFAMGVAISPNSRYLYVSKIDTLLQFDLQSANIEGSKTVAAVYDGFVDKYNSASHFGVPRLAPDGKIYIATLPTTNTLHLISRPDNPGLACTVLQHYIPLPTNNRTLPNYPFFRLGRLKGSPCDTLTPTADVFEKKDVKLYPNPDFVGAALTLELGAPLRQPGRFLIYDRLGRLVYGAALAAGMDVFHPDAAGLAAGMYFCALLEGQERVWTGKLAVMEKR